MTVWFSWLCQRCGNGFKAAGVARVCGPCASRAAAVSGRPFPFGEMGGE